MIEPITKIEYDIFTDGWGKVFRTKKLPVTAVKPPKVKISRPTGVNVNKRKVVQETVVPVLPTLPAESYIFDKTGIVLYECPICNKRGLLNETLDAIRFRAPKVLPDRVVVWPCHKHVKMAAERGL